MSTELPLRCRCGDVRGVATDVAPATGNRVVCYCADCQAFAWFLDRAADVLDPWGGTDIFQIAPAQLRITDGADGLHCMRLSSKGLFRWYSGCCNTPIANTLPPIPFLGVSHAFMDHAGDGRARDEVLGKPIAYVNGRSAVGSPPPHVHPGTPLRAGVRVTRNLLRWWIGGKAEPSAFFHSKTRAPRSTPRVLSPVEREELRERMRTGSPAPDRG